MLARSKTDIGQAIQRGKPGFLECYGIIIVEIVDRDNIKAFAQRAVCAT